MVDTLPGPEHQLYRPASRVTLAPTICPDPNDFGTLSMIKESKEHGRRNTSHTEIGLGYDPERMNSDLTQLPLQELCKLAETLNVDQDDCYQEQDLIRKIEDKRRASKEFTKSSMP